jgi:DNA-binding MarR family transcriptional regulator
MASVNEAARIDVERLIEDWKRERPSLDTTSLPVFLPLREALLHADRLRARILSRHGLTGATLDVLVGLRRSGPPYVRTPSELAASLVLSPAGVSQRLERLEQAGLIERSTRPEDRRVVSVRLTDDGRRLLDTLMDEYMAHEEQLLYGLSERDRATLSRLLIKLDQSITATESRS